jgi:hypothetical protein
MGHQAATSDEVREVAFCTKMAPCREAGQTSRALSESMSFISGRLEAAQSSRELPEDLSFSPFERASPQKEEQRFRSPHGVFVESIVHPNESIAHDVHVNLSDRCISLLAMVSFSAGGETVLPDRHTQLRARHSGDGAGCDFDTLNWPTPRN